MRKKYLSALLFGALLFASAGTFTSCKDYDDDIASLDQRLSAIEQTVQDLQSQIQAGAVITNVESTSEGVTVTLSNGKSFALTNGTPGSVVAIGDNGNWFIDGVDTGKPSQGSKGDNGMNGDYYYPGENGTFIKMEAQADGTYKEVETDIAWKVTEIGQSNVSVAYDSVNGGLIISGMEEDNVPFTTTISLFSSLKSLAVIPDKIDADTRYPIAEFYNLIKNNVVVTSTDAYIDYRLNPGNADITNQKWAIIDRTVTTRAEGDQTSLLAISGTPVRDEENSDALSVTLKSKKSLGDYASKEFPIFALQATNTKNGEVIVSDYATVGITDLKKYKIDNTAAEAEGYNWLRSEQPAITDECDVEMVYNESLDLNAVVEAYAAEHATFDPPYSIKKDLKVNVTYKFTQPTEYIGQDGVTNQQKFVTMENGVVSPADFGTAAIGRTPIFKVEAVVEGVTLATAYIKVSITDAVETPIEQQTVTVDPVAIGEVNYSDIENSKIIGEYDWERMNKEVYQKYNLTQETFESLYTVGACSSISGVELTASVSSNGATGTAPAKFALTNDVKIETDATGNFKPTEVTAYVVFTTPNTEYPIIKVPFTYTIVHNDDDFPTLNNDYLIEGTNTVQVKGRLVNNKWVMTGDIKEHFAEYLAGFSIPNHHSTPVASLAPGQTGASISEGNINVQAISLTEPLVGTSKDYTVVLTTTLDNRQSITKDYTVRFVSPFEASVGNIELETLVAEPDKAVLKDYVTVKDSKGNIIYQNGSVTQYGKDTYKLLEDDFEINYALTYPYDSEASFGDDNLTIKDDEDGEVIIWDNDGNILQTDKKAQVKVTVKVDNIVVLTENGEILVKKSE